jgi:hypothetical protein
MKERTIIKNKEEDIFVYKKTILYAYVAQGN